MQSQAQVSETDKVLVKSFLEQQIDHMIEIEENAGYFDLVCSLFPFSDHTVERIEHDMAANAWLKPSNKVKAFIYNKQPRLVVDEQRPGLFHPSRLDTSDTTGVTEVPTQSASNG